MPIINGCLELKPNAPFEEIAEQWYKGLLEDVPPAEWSSPYQNLGWFVCGEPHSHDFNTGEAYHYLCFCYNGKYYAGCRSREKTNADYEWEISAFCREIDATRGLMTIKFNTLYNPDCAYRVKLKCDRLNKTREVRLLCPGEQYIDTIREVFKARGFTILGYDLLTQN